MQRWVSQVFKSLRLLLARSMPRSVERAPRGPASFESQPHAMPIAIAYALYINIMYVMYGTVRIRRATYLRIVISADAYLTCDWRNTNCRHYFRIDMRERERERERERKRKRGTERWSIRQFNRWLSNPVSLAPYFLSRFSDQDRNHIVCISLSIFLQRCSVRRCPFLLSRISSRRKERDGWATRSNQCQCYRLKVNYDTQADVENVEQYASRDCYANVNFTGRYRDKFHG